MVMVSIKFYSGRKGGYNFVMILSMFGYLGVISTWVCISAGHLWIERNHLRRLSERSVSDEYYGNAKDEDRDKTENDKADDDDDNGSNGRCRP